VELKPLTVGIILALAVVGIIALCNYEWNEDTNGYRTDTQSVLYPEHAKARAATKQADAFQKMADQQRQPQVIIIERGTGLPQMPWAAPDPVMHVPSPFNPPVPKEAPKTATPARP